MLVEKRPSGRHEEVCSALCRRRLLSVLILLLAAYTTSRSPYFLTERNLRESVGPDSSPALVAVGQMMAILIGGIDLSVGPHGV